MFLGGSVDNEDPIDHLDEMDLEFEWEFLGEGANPIRWKMNQHMESQLQMELRKWREWMTREEEKRARENHERAVDSGRLTHPYQPFPKTRRTGL